MRKKLLKTLICVSLVSAFLSGEVPFLEAFEAHFLSVGAVIENDAPKIDIPGGEFCAAPTVSLSTCIQGAQIWYTLDGTNPVCGGTGSQYTGPITLPAGEAVLQAVTCHDGAQSLRLSWYFDVDEIYCCPLLGGMLMMEQEGTSTDPIEEPLLEEPSIEEADQEGDEVPEEGIDDETTTEEEPTEEETDQGEEFLGEIDDEISTEEDPLEEGTSTEETLEDSGEPGETE